MKAHCRSRRFVVFQSTLNLCPAAVIGAIGFTALAAFATPASAQTTVNDGDWWWHPRFQPAPPARYAADFAGNWDFFHASRAAGPVTEAAGQNLVIDDANNNNPYSFSSNQTWANITVGTTGYAAMSQTAGTLTITSDLTLGTTAASSGSYFLSGGVSNIGGNAYVGKGGIGTFNLTNGSSATVTGSLIIGGTGAGGDGRVGISGAMLNAGDIYLGHGGTGTFNIDVGTVNTGDFYVGYAGGTGLFREIGGDLNQSGVQITGTGTLYLGTGGGTGTWFLGASNDTLNVGQVVVGNGGTGTFNLQLGVLTTGRVSMTAGSTGEFIFNGGTLRAGASSTTFFQGLTTADVSNSGALIDTNGFNITIAQPLVHSTIAGDNATDGGLRKIGAGMLTLTGTNTYTGKTVVSAGTLAITSGRVGLSGSSAIFAVDGTAANAPMVTLSNASITAAALRVGDSATGTFTQSNGVVTAGALTVGNSADSSGIYNMSGGSLGVSSFGVGIAGGTGVFTQTGGIVNTGGADLLLAGGGGTATYGISGTNATLTARTIYVGNGGTATFNLDGGTVTAAGVTEASNSTGTVNFNGGTLRASGSNTEFVNVDTTNVRNGGVKIDTLGFKNLWS